jgi:hypothetical protein
MNRTLRRRLGLAAAGLVAAWVIVNQYVAGVVAEFYSPGFVSESAADAHRRGVLLARVSAPDSVAGSAGEYRVREAWIEDQQQIYYRWLFFRRDSLLHRPQLVVYLEGTCGVEFSRPLRYDDEHELDQHVGCNQHLARVQPPFPTRIRVSIGKRGSASR